MDCYTRAIDLNPKADFYFQRGFIYHSENKLDLAEADYNASLKLDSNYGSTLTNLGLIQSKRGSNIEAIDSYTRAIQANPQDPISYNNRGYIFYKLLRYK